VGQEANGRCSGLATLTATRPTFARRLVGRVEGFAVVDGLARAAGAGAGAVTPRVVSSAAASIAPYCVPSTGREVAKSASVICAAVAPGAA